MFLTSFVFLEFLESVDKVESIDSFPSKIQIKIFNFWSFPMENVHCGSSSQQDKFKKGVFLFTNGKDSYLFRFALKSHIYQQLKGSAISPTGLPHEALLFVPIS
jgi:hypothetical protein